MLKHYIHCHEGYNLNKGGSVGYLSTLYASFDRYGSFITEKGIQTQFLFPNLKEGERLYPRALEKVIYDEFGYIDEFENPNGMQVLINERKRWFREILPISEYGKIDFRKISSIHIHGAYNFLPVFNSLRREGIENQVVKIFTTHNPHKPELEDMELISRGRIWSDADIKTLKYFYQERDYWSFKLSDALMFPCEYSMEGYFKTWPEFEKLIENKKIYFCTTSGQQKVQNIDNVTMRQSLNIPQDATVLLYLGRFVNIRGYDILIEVAKKIIEKNPTVYFVVVGESTKTTEFNTKQWIQVPFTTMPGNYINMADACLCPNKGSLFDLSMIEILASGTPLIGCDVGGYKWLKGKTTGILLSPPNDVDSFMLNILDFLNLSEQDKEKMQIQNIELYQNELHLKYFYQNYSKVLDKIYEDFNITDQKSDNQISRLHIGFEQNYKRNDEQPIFFATPISTNINTVLSKTNVNNVLATNTTNTTNTNLEMSDKFLKKIVSIIPDIPDGTYLSLRQRKLRKLKNNPKQFLSDAIEKRVRKIKTYWKNLFK